MSNDDDRAQVKALAALEKAADSDWFTRAYEGLEMVDLPERVGTDPLIMTIQLPTESAREVIRTTVEAVGGTVLS